MRASEIRALTDDQLSKELEGADQDMMNLRFRGATKQLSNTSELKKSRRNRARLKTILKERQLQQEYRGHSDTDEA